ncbi:hypothetical protein VKT23_007386 [Stygiomarasmius scandens]|uniref:Major facilitator superfamily (MFS) profile domain-containing protein n=1 Tax=Marasmiellus scandens TaxID=2682957 RepID=A0ABR1JJQ6_9AGAR
MSTRVSLRKLKRSTYLVRYPRWMAGKPLLYMSCALASLGDALFGYSQGITSSLEVQASFLHRMYHKDVSPHDIQLGHTGIDPFLTAITVSCLNVTALVSSLCAAYVNDILGRRMSIRVGGIIYFIAAFIQLFSRNLIWLIAGRSLQGVGVGFLSMTVPVFQAEISPEHSRGRFISIEFFFLNCGYLLAAWVGYTFYFMHSEISWRGPFAVQAAIAFLLVVLSFWLPETPRWLIKNGFKTDGLWTLADLHGHGDITDAKINATYVDIVDALEHEELEGSNAAWKELFTRYGRRTFVAVSSQMFAQLNGINVILHFLPEHLDRAGFTVPLSLFHSGICAVLFCAGTIPTIFYIDKIGRRPFLLFGSASLAICLAVAAGVQFYLSKMSEGTKKLQAAEGLFAGVALYLFFFGATWGPTPWLLGAEIFPTRARAKGMALANISDWGFNFLTAFVTPALFEVLKGGFYVLLVSSCVFSFVVVYFVYPETAHKSLEDLGEVFGEVLPPRRNHKIEEPKVESDTLVQDSGSILQLDGNNIVEDCRNERREKDHT